MTAFETDVRALERGLASAVPTGAATAARATVNFMVLRGLMED